MQLTPELLCVLGQGNIGGGLLDIHCREQHQKRLYRLATTRLRKNNIATLLWLRLCVYATRGKPPWGIAKEAPESNSHFLRRLSIEPKQVLHQRSDP
jgi:hypothetical protein